MHRPPAQRSPSVQTSPSSHGAVLSACWHCPPAQLSLVQTLPSSQFIGSPAQTPPRQRSPIEQALASSHAAPLSLAGFEQAPVAVLQTPASWHWSDALHVTGLLPMQRPFWH